MERDRSGKISDRRSGKISDKRSKERRSDGKSEERSDRKIEKHNNEEIGINRRNEARDSNRSDEERSNHKNEERSNHRNNRNEERSNNNEKKRRNVKLSYVLDDADKNEKELILNGTISDRLNCLALLCTRNPSEQNYKQLLQFCENQRNDVIYTTLKLLRDLIKEKLPESNYIKNRIIKSFEMGCKNQYIKNKVLEILGVLCRAEIMTEPFINILISRLIEKGETLKIVENTLKTLVGRYGEMIFAGIEDFYYKNDNFRIQHNVMKFLDELNQNISFDFYNNALNSLDEYPQEQKDQMIDLIVTGLSKTVSPGDTILSINLVRNYIKSARSIISILNLLSKTEDPFTETYVLRVSRTTILRNTKYEPEFLNLVYKLQNKELFSKLVDNSFYFSVQSILALLLMANEKKVEISRMFSLHLFSKHYNPVVRNLAVRMLKGEKIATFDPFDSVYVDSMSRTLPQ